MRSLVLLLATACVVPDAPSWLPTEAGLSALALPADPATTLAPLLTVGDVVPGSPVTLTVTGVPADARVGIARGTGQEVDAGPCAAAVCLDLAAPNGVLTLATADATGTASVTVTVPASLGAAAVAFQAAAVDGAAAGTSNVVRRLVGDVGCSGDPSTGDSDGDGVCDDLDLCPDLAIDNLDGDGTCDDAQLCAAVAGVTLPAQSSPGTTLVAQVDGVPERAVSYGATASYVWTVDGVVAADLDTDTVPAGRTADGETWELTLVASYPGGAVCSGTASTVVGPSPPVCGGAAITPSPLTSDEDAVCACLDGTDADGDPVARTCAWTVDGAAAGDDSCRLDETAFVRDQTLGCTVTVTSSDGTDSDTTTAVVDNAAPQALAIAFLVDHDGLYPDQVDDALSCFALGSGDPDGDATTATAQLLVGDVVVLEAIDGTPAASIDTTPRDLYAAAGGTPALGDEVTCRALVSDGTDVTTDEDVLVVQRRPPEVTVTMPDEASVGESILCDATAVDGNGDPLDVSYSWRTLGFGAGPQLEDLGWYGDTVQAGWFVRGAIVGCEATATDAFGLSVTGTGITEIVNAAPSATGVVISDDDGTPMAGDTLTCAGQGFVDLDGDAASWRYTWRVDGVEVLVETGEVSTLAATSRGDVITCRAEPYDGERYGAAVSTDLVVENTPVVCDPPDGGSSDRTEDLTCACGGDDVDGDRSYTCTWKNWITDEVLGTDCTLPVADQPETTRVYCELTPSDSAGEGEVVASDRWQIQPTVAATITLNGGASVSPAVIPFTRDQVVSCDHPDATSSQRGGVRYGYTWEWFRSENTFVDHVMLHCDDDSCQTATLEEILAVEYVLRDSDQFGSTDFEAYEGGWISCYVTVYDAGHTRPSETARVPLDSSASDRIDTLEAGHTDAVVHGDTFACTANLGEAFTGDVDVAVQFATDPDGPWSDLVLEIDSAVTTATASHTLGDDDADTWLRCRAELDDGDLEVTEAVRAVVHAPEVAQTSALRSTTTPCEQRVCVVTVTHDDALYTDVAVDLDVYWTVNGTELARVSQAVAVEADGTQVRVEMPYGGVADGDQLMCWATATGPGDVPGNTHGSGVASISGDAPTVSAVTMTEAVRAGETFSCVPSGVDAACADTLVYDVTWRVDGQLVARSETFDTSGLLEGEVLTCEVSAGDADGGGFGPATASAPATLLPDRWTLHGAELGGLAGTSIAVLDDYDGDGLPEVAVGAPDTTASSGQSSGRLYVVPGSSVGGVATLDALAASGRIFDGQSGGWSTYETICQEASFLANWGCTPGQAGQTVDGSNEAPIGDGLGTRMTRGDVDGDGITDLLLSAPYALANGQFLAGRTYVFPGADLWDPTTLGLVTFPAAAYSARLEGASGVWPTRNMSQAGIDDAWDGHLSGYGLAGPDMDGDGLTDLAVGAPNGDHDGLENNGTTYVVYGAPALGEVALADVGDAVDGVDGFVGEGDRSGGEGLQSHMGGHLANVGDMDGDGDDELLVANLQLHGWAFVVHGGEDPGRLSFAERLPEGTSALGGQDFGLTGFITEDSGTNSAFDLISYGRMMHLGLGSGAGDVNGDGLADLVVPWLEAEDGGQLELTVWHGRQALPTVFPEDDPDDGSEGFVVEGQPGDAGVVEGTWRTAPLGDVDGDGLDDFGFAVGVGSAAETIDRWRLYVVFGRTETTGLTFADLEAGEGGLVLDWLGADDPIQALTAGDVDGDGLSDVLVGFPTADDNGQGTGRVEVWFGRDVRGAVTHRGFDDDDVLLGSGAADAMVGGRGDDELSGGGGADALSGVSGDDVLRIGDAAPLRVRGGLGVDTLVLDGGFDLVLADLRGRVEDIEAIELGGGTLTLTERDVLRASQGNWLVVTGTGTLAVPEGSWTATGVSTWNGETVVQVESGNATLAVASSVDTLFAPRLVTTQASVDEGVTGPITTVTGSDPDGTVVAVDVDVSGAPGLAFDPSTWLLSAADGSLLDHEADEAVSLTVTLTDDDRGTTLDTLVLTIGDVNEPPAFASEDSYATVEEGAASATLVSFVFAADPDQGDTFDYAITAGQTGSAFTVDDEGRITVDDGSFLDFEQQPSYTLEITATDVAGLSSTRTLQVELSDVDAITSVGTVPFYMTGLSLDSGAIEELLEHSDVHASLDLEISADQEDLAGLSVNDFTTPIGFSFESDGTMDITGSLDWTGPDLNAYLPIEVTLDIPHQIVEGVPVDLSGSWVLQDDAVMWGQTESVDFDFDLTFTDAYMRVDYPGLQALLSNDVNDRYEELWGPRNGTAQVIDLHLDPLTWTGGKVALDFPDGFTLETDNSAYVAALRDEAADVRQAFNDFGDDLLSVDFSRGTFEVSGGSDWEAFSEVGDVIETFVTGPLQYADAGTPPTQELVYLFFSGGEMDLDFPVENAERTLYSGPEFIGDLEETYVDPYSLMADALGFASVAQSRTKRWMYLEVPVDPYGTFTLEAGLVRNYLEAGVATSQSVFLEVVDVTMVLTVENGDVVYDGPVEDLGSVTFPVGSDVDGDNRIDLTIDYDVEARAQLMRLQYFPFATGSDILYGWIAYYENEYDESLNQTGQTLFDRVGYGPLLDDWEYVVPNATTV